MHVLIERFWHQLANRLSRLEPRIARRFSGLDPAKERIEGSGAFLGLMASAMLFEQRVVNTAMQWCLHQRLGLRAVWRQLKGDFALDKLHRFHYMPPMPA